MPVEIIRNAFTDLPVRGINSEASQEATSLKNANVADIHVDLKFTSAASWFAELCCGKTETTN